jgi:hypothetical protein
MTKAMPQDALSDDKDQEGYDSQEDLINFGSTSSEAGQTPNSKTHPCMLALRAIEVVKMGEKDNDMGIRITTTEDFPVSSLIYLPLTLCRCLRLHSNAPRSWRLVSMIMTKDFCQMATWYPLLNIV